MGNQTFPYTQQVVFSDGRKQNFVFTAKTREDAHRLNGTRAQVMLSSSEVKATTFSSELQNPLLRLQKLVSNTEPTKSSSVSKAPNGNIVIIKSEELQSCGLEGKKEISARKETDDSKRMAKDVKQSCQPNEAMYSCMSPKILPEPIDLSVSSVSENSKHRKRPASDWNE